MNNERSPLLIICSGLYGSGRRVRGELKALYGRLNAHLKCSSQASAGDSEEEPFVFSLRPRLLLTLQTVHI